jgi:hypothetical protein
MPGGQRVIDHVLDWLVPNAGESAIKSNGGWAQFARLGLSALPGKPSERGRAEALLANTFERQGAGA